MGLGRGLYEAAGEEPWKAVVAGDDAGDWDMETRGGVDCEDRGGSRDRAAAGAAGLKSTVASFVVCCGSSPDSAFWLLSIFVIVDLVAGSVCRSVGRLCRRTGAQWIDDRSPWKADSSPVLGRRGSFSSCVLSFFYSRDPKEAVPRLIILWTTDVKREVGVQELLFLVLLLSSKQTKKSC